MLFANHRTSGYLAKRIACANSVDSQWVNLVYKLTREDLIPVFPSGKYAYSTMRCYVHIPKDVRIHECYKSYHHFPQHADLLVLFPDYPIARQSGKVRFFLQHLCHL